MCGSEGSPWFRRAAYVFAAYVAVVVVGLAVAWPTLSAIGAAVFVIVAWLPAGPFFAACVFEDADWRRERDLAVGDDWWIYLLSAVIQAAALWYLLRRASKASRYRNLRRADATGRD